MTSRRRNHAAQLLATTFVLACLVGNCATPRDDGSDLEPRDAVDAVIDAAHEYPLVALGEFHQLQEWHGFMSDLLGQAEFAETVDDLVVEFGNALHQGVADRFVVDLEPVPFDELAGIWRDAGSVLWDAPVYEQVFRQVRDVNERLAPEQRLRVVLGGPAVDYDAVESAADVDELTKADRGDAFFVEVVEREVIARDRRAVLIYGADHLRRGVYANTGPGDPSAATLLERGHPGQLFIVYPLPFEYDAELRDEIEDALATWPSPSIAHLPDSWLGAQPASYRALDPDSTFADQVDAVLWLGPRETLTAARADPAIYRDGDYADELRRRSAILSEHLGEPIDYVAEGLRLATSGPRMFTDPPRE